MMRTSARKSLFVFSSSISMYNVDTANFCTCELSALGWSNLLSVLSLLLCLPLHHAHYKFSVIRIKCLVTTAPGRNIWGKPRITIFQLISFSIAQITQLEITVQILCFWTLSIVLSLSKTPSCLFFKTQRFGDWIRLRLQVKPTLLGPIDGVSPCLRVPVPAPRSGT
jgi:hypothetical protein